MQIGNRGPTESENSIKSSSKSLRKKRILSKIELSDLRFHKTVELSHANPFKDNEEEASKIKS